MLGRVRRHCFGSTDRRSTASAWSSSHRDGVPARPPLQVMDDRVPLRRRHLQLGLDLARQAAVVRSEEPEAEKDSRHIPSLKWSPINGLPSGGGQLLLTPHPQTDGLQTCAWRVSASVWDGSTAGSVAFQATVFVHAATHRSIRKKAPTAETGRNGEGKS
jgi:hypothetical protein